MGVVEHDDIDSLPPDTLLIRVDLVQPGDVLLTHGGTLLSKAIVAATNGTYSHAALFINSYQLFESYDLVEHSCLTLVGSTVINNVPIQWAKLPHNPIDAALFRHPQAHTIPPGSFEKTSLKLMESFWGMEYSLYSRLIAPARFPEPLATLSKSLATLYDRYWVKSEIPGPFCSELVAIMFAQLELTLTACGPPDLTTPNDLALSQLVKIDGAIRRRSELPDLRSLSQEVQLLDEPTSGDHLAHHMLRLRKTRRAIDDFYVFAVASLTRFSALLRNHMIDHAAELVNLCEQTASLSTYPEFKTDWIGKRVTQLVGKFLRLACEVPVLCEQLQKNDPTNPKAFIEFFDELDALRRSHMLCATIVNLRRLRPLRVEFEKPENRTRWIRRILLKRSRRKMLRIGRSMLRDRSWTQLRVTLLGLIERNSRAMG
jgi:hypothetical protein